MLVINVRVLSLCVHIFLALKTYSNNFLFALKTKSYSTEPQGDEKCYIYTKQFIHVQAAENVHVVKAAVLRLQFSWKDTADQILKIKLDDI